MAAVLGAGGLAVAAIGGTGAGLHAQAAEVIPNDVWVDNAGGHAGPFHDDDRRLSCAPITVTGARFAHSSGSFEIVLVKPSARRDHTVLEARWQFDRSQGGHQLLHTLSGAELVSKARALGAVEKAGGYHFEFRFLQQPHQHKPFWVSADCPVKAAEIAPRPVAAATAPVAPVPSTSTPVAKAAAVSPPKTGADVRWGDAALLVLGGAGLLGGARRLWWCRWVSRG